MSDPGTLAQRQFRRVSSREERAESELKAVCNPRPLARSECSFTATEKVSCTPASCCRGPPTRRGADRVLIGIRDARSLFPSSTSPASTSRRRRLCDWSYTPLTCACWCVHPFASASALSLLLPRLAALPTCMSRPASFAALAWLRSCVPRPFLERLDRHPGRLSACMPDCVHVRELPR